MVLLELSPTLRAHLDALEPYLEDPSVSEILVAGPDRTFVTRGGRSAPIDLVLGEARLRSMADRLLRAMGSRGRPERHEVQTGQITEDLEVTVIGAPRGARCPLVRVIRRRVSARSLDDILGAERLAGEVEAILLDAPHERRTILFSGPHGAPRLDLVVAMAGAWHRVGRVLALEAEGGPVAAAGVADIALDPDVGVDAIRAVAPDVVVAIDPLPATWCDLLRVGRPLVVSVEAPDGDLALSRIMALVLAGASDLSRPAAEALVEAGINSVVELAGTPGESAIGRVGRPAFAADRLRFSSLTRADSKVMPTPQVVQPSTSDRPSPSAVQPLRRLDTGEFVDREINELLPEDLVSKSFVHRLESNVEDPREDSKARARSRAKREAVKDLEQDGLVILSDSTPEHPVEVPLNLEQASDAPAPIEDPPAPIVEPDEKPAFDVPDSLVAPASEDNTQFGADAHFARASSMAIPGGQTSADGPAASLDLDESLDPARTLAGGEVMAAFDDAVEAVVAVETPARRPNERIPTLVGGEEGVEPGSEAWAAEAYEAALESEHDGTVDGVEPVDMTLPLDGGREASSPFGPFDDQDMMTSSGIAPPTLDPFEIGVIDQASSPFDATRAGGLTDQTIGPQDGIQSDVSADDVYDSRLEPAIVDVADEEEWDEDGPSVIIDGPPLVGGYEPPPAPDDPDRTRAGSFTPDVPGTEEEEPAPRVRKARRPPKSRGAKNGASDGEKKKTARRRPPGRRVD